MQIYGKIVQNVGCVKSQSREGMTSRLCDFVSENGKWNLTSGFVTLCNGYVKVRLLPFLFRRPDGRKQRLKSAYAALTVFTPSVICVDKFP